MKKPSKQLQKMMDSFVRSWTPTPELLEDFGMSKEEIEEEVQPELLKSQLEEIVTQALQEGAKS